MMNFLVHSPAFEDGSPIPQRYAHDGGNIAPPLEWEGAPAETRSYMLVVEDPDAPRGTFRHWGVYNIPADCTRLPEGVRLADAMGCAVNDFGHRQWDGPEPPRGHGRHHYHFRFAALDVDSLPVPPDAKAEQLWKAAQGHIIGQAELVGTYERQ